MKVAILTPTFAQFSGPDRVVENEAEEYLQKGHSVTVFTLRGGIKPKGFHVVELGMPNNSFFERLYRLFFFLDILKVLRIARILRNYDEIISFLYPMTIIATTANKYYGKKYVYYNVGVAYPELFTSILEKYYMKLFNLFTNFTVKNASTSISISDFLRRELKKETGVDGKVKYVKVDAKIYNKKLDKKRTKKILTTYKMKSPALLYVGRLSPHKGIHLLLKAFELILIEKPNASLTIVGKPTFDKYAQQLNMMAKRINKKFAGSVRFTGFVTDEELPYFYSACDIYITATLWEGFDIPAVSAQMCGKKVVAFDVGSHPEVVKKGILVRKGDIDGFAAAVIKSLKQA